MNEAVQIPLLTLASIETERLLLRPLKVEDAHDYQTLEADPEVKEFVGGASKCSAELYRSAIAKGTAGLPTTLAITLKQTGQFLGRCGFTLFIEDLEVIGWEINIVLGRQCPRRQGYAAEIGLALIRRGFETGLDTIFGVADAKNIASLKLCDKLGMKHTRDTTRYRRPARVHTIRKLDCAAHA
jgi:RimJ/RimL family protein N-acetyltransferase